MPKPPAPSQVPPAPKTAPTWVKILVLWHVFAITVYACPNPQEGFMQGRVMPAPLAVGDWLRFYDWKYLKPLAAIRLYTFNVGTWQYWDMFAPNPADTDWYGDSVVTYQDGSKKTVSFHRILDLPIPMKYLEERYRKFFERVHETGKLSTSSAYMLAPVAYRIALENYSNPKNPPIRIEMRQYWKPITPPDVPEPKDYTRQSFFTLEVDPAILASHARS